MQSSSMIAHAYVEIAKLCRTHCRKHSTAKAFPKTNQASAVRLRLRKLAARRNLLNESIPILSDTRNDCSETVALGELAWRRLGVELGGAVVEDEKVGRAMICRKSMSWPARRTRGFGARPPSPRFQGEDAKVEGSDFSQVRPSRQR